MDDSKKINADLIKELERLRKRIGELESGGEGSVNAEAAPAGERRYQVLLDTMVQGVQENDISGIITYSNPAHHRILGYAQGELLGKAIWDLQPSDEDKEYLKRYLLSLAEKQPLPTPYLTVSRRRDGSLVELQVDWNYLRDNAGRLKGFISVITDITDRKRYEDALRHRTQGLTTLLEVSRSLAETLDLGTVLQATTDGVTRLFGFETAAVYLIDEDVLRLLATTPPLPTQFPDELRNAPVNSHPHIRQAISSGKPVLVPDILTVELTPSEGAVVEQRGLRTVLYLPLIAGVKSIGALIVGSVGKPKSVSDNEIDLCSTLANLSALAVENARLFRSGQRYAAELERTLEDRKRMEQERIELERQLLHSQKLESLGLLAGGIAHDFNNIMMAILGNLDLAYVKLSLDSPVMKNIEQSILAARRATDLTRQMLAYSGKGRFLVTPLDLSKLMEENAHLFRASVPRTVTLDLRLDWALPTIEADAGQIQQVIMNLITNASEAIGDAAGTIAMTTGTQDCDALCLKKSRLEDIARPGKFVYLEVSDTGGGMNEETRQLLFDPFFTTKATGRGLGMSAILGIVRGHRGAIFIESNIGMGTAIRILFPVQERVIDAEQVEKSQSAAVREPREIGAVLVVDDEESVRCVCKEMVELFNKRVFTASDGREAVEVLRKNWDSISHIILDLNMPHMDGMTAYNELVRIKPDLKIILSSGYNEQESVQRLSGSVAFVQKPYTIKNLREALGLPLEPKTDP